MARPTQTELESLIKYWRDSYAINFIKRTPQANARILATIKRLEELKELKDGKQAIAPKF